MTVYALGPELIFPPPDLAEPELPLCVGGDLSPRRLLLAYSMGIFPWFARDLPILWWSPEHRAVLELETYRPSRSLLKSIRRNPWEIRIDTAFAEVIAACAATPRRHEEGTWITPEMADAYQKLHQLGYAHSVECWEEDELIGGLYGIAMGRCFFGESMFHRRTDASKVAFSALVERLKALDYEVLDCQVQNEHLASLGVIEIGRDTFLRRLSQAGLRPSTDPPPGLFI